MRESDEKVKQKLAEKKQRGVASDMKGERHFKGTLSFALAHTQACYKDSEPFTIFTYRVFFFFLISVAYNVNKQEKLLYVAVTAHSISGTSKNIKKLHQAVLSF